jgi:hypothetical protein
MMLAFDPFVVYMGTLGPPVLRGGCDVSGALIVVGMPNQPLQCPALTELCSLKQALGGKAVTRTYFGDQAL